MKLSFIYYSKWDKLELVVNHKMRTVSKEFRVRYFVRIPFENGRQSFHFKSIDNADRGNCYQNIKS